jgi:SWI/SNF-related matrix-associated actin-dependent regulator of chromatin subfamily A member 5
VDPDATDDSSGLAHGPACDGVEAEDGGESLREEEEEEEEPCGVDLSKLTRASLLALVLQHSGCDLSKRNLSKAKLAKRLPEALLRRAMSDARRPAQPKPPRDAKAARKKGPPQSDADEDAQMDDDDDEKARSPVQVVSTKALDARRLEHNSAAAAACAALQPLREAYLAKHLSVLRPFIPPSVADRLAAATPDGEAARSTPSKHAARTLLPRQLIAALRPHQKEGFRWLTAMYASGCHPILGDEMGLGKTLQAIALLAHATFTGSGGPHLVVCPLSVLPSWLAELARWCPDLRAARAHTSDAGERARLVARLADVRSYDVALTTYEMVHADGPLGAALRNRTFWDVLVLDEGHKAKNEHAVVSQAIRTVRRKCTLLLTGTLLQNNMHELWALLQMQYPDVFTDSSAFDEAFSIDSAPAAGEAPTHRIDDVALRAAHALLQPLCLRREKQHIEQNLPPKAETHVLCPLSKRQTELYRAALRRNVACVDGHGGGGAGLLKSLCMELRLLCCHPRLVPTDSDSDDSDSDSDEAVEVSRLVAESGKLEVLDRLLAKLHASGHRVVLFSQFTSMLDVLERLLEQRGYKFARLDGNVCRARRTVDIMLFNRPKSDLFLFLASTKAGGLGVNLQSADTCILYDSDWNPQADAQAMARVHRIGQTKKVCVFRLVTANSVEERMVARAEKKLYLDAVVARGAGGATAPASDAAAADADTGAALTAEDLRFGADSLFRSDSGEAPTDEELEALCDRSEGGDARRSQIQALRASAAVTAQHLAAAPPPLASLLGEEETAEARRAAASAASAALAAQMGLERAARRRKPAVAAAAPPSAAVARGSGRQIAGRDYSHSAWCQSCWDGGELFLCSSCPASYHAKCSGESAKTLRRLPNWNCPHHSCSECGRGPAAAGGLLFRCESCPAAFCDEHLPEDVVACGRLVDTCGRFQRLGQNHPPNAMFIHCSEDCADWAAQRFGMSPEEELELAPPRAPAWVQPGDEELLVPSRRDGQLHLVSLRRATFSLLKGFLGQVYDPKAPLPDGLTGATALRNVLAADGDAAFGALYGATRTALQAGLTLPAADAVATFDEREQEDSEEDSSDASDAESSSGSDEDEGHGATEPEQAKDATAAPAGPQPQAGGGAVCHCARRVRIMWTARETDILRALVATYGTRWAVVHAASAAAGVTAGRTADDLAKRWYYLTRQARDEAAKRAQQASEQPAAAAAPPRAGPTPAQQLASAQAVLQAAQAQRLAQAQLALTSALAGSSKLLAGFDPAALSALLSNRPLPPLPPGSALCTADKTPPAAPEPSASPGPDAATADDAPLQAEEKVPATKQPAQTQPDKGGDDDAEMPSLAALLQKPA